ncbi:hypothetical protein P4S64_21115 [Vibrio sp. M60_M31a]
MTQELAVTESERTRILVLVLSGVATVKALALEARMTYRYKDVNHENLKKQNEVDWQAAKLQELIQGASLGTTLALVIVEVFGGIGWPNDHWWFGCMLDLGWEIGRTAQCFG